MRDIINHKILLLVNPLWIFDLWVYKNQWSSILVPVLKLVITGSIVWFQNTDFLINLSVTFRLHIHSQKGTPDASKPDQFSVVEGMAPPPLVYLLGDTSKRVSSHATPKVARASQQADALGLWRRFRRIRIWLLTCLPSEIWGVFIPGIFMYGWWCW